MIYVTDLIFILRMVFIETRTAEGIRPLDQPLIDAVFSAYTKQRRNTIHKAVDRYLNERTGSVELSSENITQRMQALMRGSDTRFNFVVNIPTLPCREPRERYVFVSMYHLCLRLIISQYGAPCCLLVTKLRG